MKRRPSPWRYGRDRKQEAKRLLAAGLTMQEVADGYSISINGLRTLLGRTRFAWKYSGRRKKDHLSMDQKADAVWSKFEDPDYYKIKPRIESSLKEQA